jgi:N-acetylmuramoyl-L-alanine amidase
MAKSRNINWVVIHQSASNNPAHDDISVIRKWHLDRQFSDVGYHYFIKKNGEVQKGRDESQKGAHVQGHNSDSIGLCLSGEGEKTPEQLRALEILLIDILGRHGLTKKDVLGHKDLAATECPGFDLSAWLDSLPWS